MRKFVWLMASLWSIAGAGEVVLENPRVRLAIGSDATWRSVVAKATAKELCPKGNKTPLATVRIGNRTHRSNRLHRGPHGRLWLAFGGCDTRLAYQVRQERDWILFRLKQVEGARPGRVTLVRLPVAVTAHVGRRLAGAWNNELAACVSAANLQTDCGARGRGDHAELWATTQDSPGPRLEGAAFAIVVCPTADLDTIMARLAETYDLPRNCDARGRPSRTLPIARQSYWFLTFGEKDVGRVIDLCRRSGIRQVMMGSWSWCRSVGHYLFNTSRYPDGLESLRRTVARLHEAGILVGMHCFASKVLKSDPYVSPVPDPRFLVDRRAVLAAEIGKDDRTIRTASDLSQWPGSPVCRQKLWEGGVAKHREVVIDDEIIRYEAIGPPGAWNTFLGCVRGAWGTKAAPHKKGATCRHYAVDGCINGYIIDQETSLLDETTSRLARVFNSCGFDMVYFDGGEDVDRRRFHYYVSKFQAVAMSKFTRRPLIHMGTIMTHNLIHSFTRSGTVDTYLNTIRGRIIAGAKVGEWPTVRDHIDRSVAYMLSVGEDRVPGELGWFGIWPKGKNTDGLQLDEVEYLMCKSLAYDAPISLQTSFAQMDRHPLTPGILEIVRAYEDLRRSGAVGAATRRRLGQRGKSFALVRDDRGGPRFVEVEPVPRVAGGRAVRAWVGEAKTGKPTAYACVWHYLGVEGKLVVATERLEAFDIAGRPVAVGKAPGGGAVVPIGGRRILVRFDGATAETARELLANARFEPARSR